MWKKNNNKEKKIVIEASLLIIIYIYIHIYIPRWLADGRAEQMSKCLKTKETLTFRSRRVETNKRNEKHVLTVATGGGAGMKGH